MIEKNDLLQPVKKFPLFTKQFAFVACGGWLVAKAGRQKQHHVPASTPIRINIVCGLGGARILIATHNTVLDSLHRQQFYTTITHSLAVILCSICLI